MNESHANILRKIQKCLALAQSSEPHEAAAALRQARALMEMHGISEEQAAVSDIAEADCPATGKKTIPEWEGRLANAVASTLGCRVLFRTGELNFHEAKHGAVWMGGRKNGALVFVGAGSSPAIAVYAFEVLRRQLRKARSNFRRETGYADAKRMDAFCLGWVSAVRGKIKDLQSPSSVLQRVDEAIRQRDPEMGVAKSRDASGLTKGDKSYLMAASHGLQAGLDAQLHSGLYGAGDRAALPMPERRPGAAANADMGEVCE